MEGDQGPACEEFDVGHCHPHVVLRILDPVFYNEVKPVPRTHSPDKGVVLHKLPVGYEHHTRPVLAFYGRKD